MIPQSMKISGFLSYQDPVELDFRGFDLACISGANGAGKSSLLDAITWVLFGQARRGGDAIINSKSKTAEISFEFLYEENLYKIQRIKTRDKTMLLEFFVRAEDGHWNPLTEATLRQTEARIQSTLRLDYETFINASFFLQGRADQFAQQKPGDRKRILSTVLGLEVWEEYREAAAERRKQVEDEVRVIRERLRDIEQELATEPEVQRTLQQHRDNLARVTALRQAQEKTLEAARRLSAALEGQRRTLALLDKQAADAESRCTAMQDQIARRQAEREGYASLLAEEPAVRAAYDNWQSARADVEHWDSLSRDFHAFDGQRTPHLLAVEKARTTLEAEQTALLDQQRTLVRGAAQSAEHSTQLQGLQARQAELQAHQVRRAELPALIAAAIEKVSNLNAEKASLSAKMDELKKNIEALQAASGAVCPLCGQPLTPAERQRHLAEQEAAGKALGDRHRAIVSTEHPAAAQQRAALEAELRALESEDRELRALERQVGSLQDSLMQLENQQTAWEQNGAPRLAEITVALQREDFAAEAQAALQTLDKQIAELGYDAGLHQFARQTEQAGRASEARLRQVENARAALAPLEQQISEQSAALPAARQEMEALRADAARLRSQLDEQTAGLPDEYDAETRLFDLQQEENRLHTSVGGALQNVNYLQAQRTHQAEYSARRDELNVQVAQLKSLERAFGKDGVPALLIEQALPDIEAQANDILDRISGGSMSVRFETQRDYKDAKREDRKETLDIIISDAAGSREYELFSGGEAFRVNFAIRLALSRVLAQRAGARLRTLVIDEGFGSQDTDGRQRLIEAINLVRKDFDRILVITHLEELKDAFPARIEVEKTPRGSRLSVMTT